MLSGCEAFDADNLCLSGGAAGSDLQWGMCAGRAGHGVIHWSFARHRTFAPREEVVILTERQLHEADPFLVEANKTLHRTVPFNKPHIMNLLRRDYFQVQWSNRVYVVSTVDRDDTVKGGSGWAVQMFLDRKPDGEVYLFDQKAGRWLSWQAGWAVILTPPKPFGIWAGIGARDLLLNGKEAIRALMEYTPEPLAA